MGVSREYGIWGYGDRWPGLINTINYGTYTCYVNNRTCDEHKYKHDVGATCRCGSTAVRGALRGCALLSNYPKVAIWCYRHGSAPAGPGRRWWDPTTSCTHELTNL